MPDEATGSTRLNVPVSIFRNGAALLNHSRVSSRSYTPRLLFLPLMLGKGRRECSHHSVRRNLALVHCLGLKVVRLTGIRLNKRGPSLASSVSACIRLVYAASALLSSSRWPASNVSKRPIVLT